MDGSNNFLKLLAGEATEQLGWWVNTDSYNDLVSSSNKPLPEPMLTQIYVAIWLH